MSIEHGTPFVMALGSRDCLWPHVDRQLIRRIHSAGGVTGVISAVERWNPPQSYVDESGRDLLYALLILRVNISLHEIVELKHEMIDLEDFFSRNGRRRLNLNAGIVTGQSVILASHKEGPLRHRIGKAAVWTELQWAHANGSLSPLPNAFCEYRTPSVANWLTQENARLNSVADSYSNQ